MDKHAAPNIPPGIKKIIEGASSLDDLLDNKKVFGFLSTIPPGQKDEILLQVYSKESESEKQRNSRFLVNGKPITAKPIRPTSPDMEEALSLYELFVINPGYEDNSAFRNYHTYGFYLDDELIGAYSCGVEDSEVLNMKDISYLSAIAVNPDFQKKGLGRYMVDHFVAHRESETPLWFCRVYKDCTNTVNWMNEIYTCVAEGIFGGYREMAFDTTPLDTEDNSR